MDTVPGGDTEHLLRRLPSVERLLDQEAFRELEARFGRGQLVDATRAALAELREAVRGERLDGRGLETALAELPESVRTKLVTATTPSLSRLINASGVIIHTNLGRAPLSASAMAAMERIARSYSNLEYDLQEGGRGRRDQHAAGLLERLFPGYDSLVVNNNAAAVLLVLNTFAASGEVLLSRGELVEIGGSFRVPDILERSGACLREVGTTNKTRIADYQEAVGSATALILRVHPSNFRIVGFTERASTEELVALGKAHGVPVVEDFGSGNLLSLAAYGLPNEPTVQASLDAGVDLVTFSGDKLLGGPQAGILVGRPDRVDACRKNPLTRALRVGKLTYAALEATLRSFVRGRAAEEIPVLRMLAAPAGEIRSRAQRLVRSLPKTGRVELSLVDGFSKVGGGAAPETEIPTCLIAVRAGSASAQTLAERLRAHEPPVIARIAEDRVLLDLRTVLPEEEGELASALGELAEAERS
jgi:L-seryl-tRNA(Ser) seleniumtransferase